MQFNQINKMDLINQLFVFNKEFNERKGAHRHIISSFFKHTPACVIYLLLSQDIKIKFKTSTQFEEFGKDSDVAGFYYSQKNEIWILSNINHPVEIIRILHHEIGHFIDDIFNNFYYFQDNSLISLNSMRNPYIQDILHSEGFIYEDTSYYLTSASEFFAQSYCEYALNSGLLINSDRIYAFIEKSLSYLDTYFNLIKSTNKKIYRVYFLDDDCFISTFQQASNKNFQLGLFSNQNDYKILFEDVSFFSVRKLDFGKNKFVVECIDSSMKSQCCLLKDREIIIYSSNVISPSEQLQSKAELPFLLISDHNKFDFIFKKDGIFFKLNYSFDKVLQVNDSSDIIAIGVNTDCINFIGRDLRVLKTVPGEYIDFYTASPEIDHSDPIVYENSAIVIKNHDTINLYSHEGCHLTQCQAIKQFTVSGINSFEIVSYNFIFIKYKSHSELINLTTRDFSIVNFDSISICKPIEIETLDSTVSFENYESLGSNSYFFDEFSSIVKIDINGELFIANIDADSGKLCNIKPIPYCDDIFLPPNSDYILGITFNNNNIDNIKDMFARNNIKNIKMIDIRWDYVKIIDDNLNYSNFIFNLFTHNIDYMTDTMTLEEQTFLMELNNIGDSINLDDIYDIYDNIMDNLIFY